jgi:choline dehydrogenase-like flavoprotein
MQAMDTLPDPEKEQWDAIVVGTGMGGSTFGYELARRGRRVLFLEKGRFLHHQAESRRDAPGGASSADARLRDGLWPQLLRDERAHVRPRSVRRGDAERGARRQSMARSSSGSQPRTLRRVVISSASTMPVFRSGGRSHTRIWFRTTASPSRCIAYGAPTIL